LSTPSSKEVTMSWLPRPDRRGRPGRQTGTVVLSLWVVVGVFVDGWAHFNRPGLETFFTPWHALLYSGAAALFGWLLLPGRAPTPTDRRWALAAAGIFTTGGVGDLLWHEVFGVEAGLAALVSPTHLLLLLGGLLGVTAPLREHRVRPEGRGSALPALGSVTLATALSAFFLLYISPFTSDAPTQALTAIPEGAPGHEQAEAPAVAGLAAYLVTTAVIVVPVLVLHARRSLPFGAIALLVGTVATLSSAVTEFDQPAAPVAALLAGLGADVVVRVSDRLPARTRSALIGAALPLLVWPAQLVGVALTAGVRWPAELVVGAPVLSATFGAALGLLHGQPFPPRPGRTPAPASAGTAPAMGR
jgi:hypothetical protein